MDKNDVVRLFFEMSPISIDIKNTSHGDEDFRETLLVDFDGEKRVIKLCSNGFTDEKHIALWERIAEEYRKLGYYCPLFIRALDGTFPIVIYKERKCIAWREEFSKYRSADELIREKFSDDKLVKDGWYSFLEDAMIMDAIVKKVYSFSDMEKKAAPLLYKCIRPLWWYASDELKEAGSDDTKIQHHLDAIEYEQTREIDFSRHM
jgi:hypothetical protein